MKKNGFTIIEILIALTVMALLAAMTFTVLYSSMKKIEIQSTISNVAYSVINTLNKTRLASVKNEDYLKLNYNLGNLSSSNAINTVIASYQLPKDFYLDATPTSINDPFSDIDPKGYYLNYFVSENSDSLTIDTNYSFLVVSEYDNSVIREIKVDNGLPYVVGE